MSSTLDLRSGQYQPYRKPNNTTKLLHTHSDHPPVIIAHLSKSINQCLSAIPSHKDTIMKAVQPYQQTLTGGGYKHCLVYKPANRNKDKKCNNRKRNILYYNSSFSKHVATNVGQMFQTAIRKILVHCKHPLHKIFN